jgi:hypothetical protein
MLRVETEFKFYKIMVFSEVYMDVNRRLRTTKISLKLKQYILQFYEMLIDIGSLRYSEFKKKRHAEGTKY